MNLVTLDEARRHLRLDDVSLDSNGDPLPLSDDPDLALKIAGASAAVLNYLKGYRNLWEREYLADTAGFPLLTPTGKPIPVEDSNGDPVYVIDSNGDRIIVDAVRSATLLMLGFLWRDRDENADGAYEQGFLPKPVTALLYPLRDPAVR